VVLRGDDVVSEGWHASFGGPHAEWPRCTRLAKKAKGSTLVVSLEPCSPPGQDAAVYDAILAAGVRRVVAAITIPTSTRAADSRS
jgi:diaminohydroxyphosphoribosylaminopyrimidine deaminase/5-amino-6-(5-phosphoribosylamino)uracil reductase